MSTSPQTVHLKYTAPPKPTIGYFSDSAFQNIWESPSLAAGTSCTYTINRNPADKDRFHFKAITFWAKDANNDLAGNTARTFEEDTKNGIASFNGRQYITKVEVESHKISFIITNCNGQDESGFISFQTTIVDKNSKARHTSLDPQVPLPAPDHP